MQGVQGERARSIQLRHRTVQRRTSGMACHGRCASAVERALRDRDNGWEKAQDRGAVGMRKRAKQA